ncbi:MAG: CBS domain-containing protein [bacterium]|nr:CBS domain-containing protein [bacterium]
MNTSAPHALQKSLSPFSNSMGNLIKGPVQTIQRSGTIREAAMKMSQERIGSLIVVDDNHPVGIVTKTDLAFRAVAQGKDFEVPIVDVMSPGIISIRHDRPIFDGLMLMLDHKITHLLIKDGEKNIGVVSEHDWLMFQERHPASLLKAIRKAETIETLAGLRYRSLEMIKDIFEEEGNAESLTEICTTINDYITETIIANALREMREEGKGDPPVGFTWIAMGSEGRCEQTTSTDQDNGLIFEDVPAARLPDTKKWFLELAEKVVSGLEICGFPRCKGNVMAVNPELCLPIEGWHQLFSKMIATPENKALLNASVYFDFRALFGKKELADDLWQRLLDTIQRNKAFLRFFADMMITAGRPPVNDWLWQLRALLAFSSPSLDIKIQALAPLVMSTRILSLSCGTSVTHTLDRLKIIEEHTLLTSAMTEAIKETYDFLMLLRIRHDFSKRQGEVGDNTLFLTDLNPLQRRFLKDSLKSVHELQYIVSSQFGGTAF